jgi:hypothetical protein
MSWIGIGYGVLVIRWGDNGQDYLLGYNLLPLKAGNGLTDPCRTKGELG